MELGRTRSRGAEDKETCDEDDYCIIDNCSLACRHGSTAQTGDEVEFLREDPSQYRTHQDHGVLVGFNRFSRSKSDTGPTCSFFVEHASFSSSHFLSLQDIESGAPNTPSGEVEALSGKKLKQPAFFGCPPWLLLLA